MWVTRLKQLNDDFLIVSGDFRASCAISYLIQEIKKKEQVRRNCQGRIGAPLLALRRALRGAISEPCNFSRASALMLSLSLFPFGGSRVRFPVKSLGFFSEFFFNGKRTLDTGCFGAGFSLEFFLRKNYRFFLAPQVSAWANAKQCSGICR